MISSLSGTTARNPETGHVGARHCRSRAKVGSSRDGTGDEGAGRSLAGRMNDDLCAVCEEEEEEEDGE